MAEAPNGESGFPVDPMHQFEIQRIIPFEIFVDEDPVVSYVGIRADENREGYISTNATATEIYTEKLLPAVRDGLSKAGRADDASAAALEKAHQRQPVAQRQLLGVDALAQAGGGGRAADLLFVHHTLLALALTTPAALAVEALSTEELMSHCDKYYDEQAREDRIFCVRYIQGFIDGAVATDSAFAG